MLVMVVAGIGVAAAEHYAKVAEIKIGGAGAFDYLTVDSAAKRLYVTHGTEVVVIDLTTNAIVGRIADTPRVHGIAIGANGRGFTSNGGENKVGIVDLKTLDDAVEGRHRRQPRRHPVRALAQRGLRLQPYRRVGHRSSTPRRARPSRP